MTSRIALALIVMSLMAACRASLAPSIEPIPRELPPTEPAPVSWLPDELAVLRSLWIGSLPDLPPDPSNTYGDDPAVARLGQKLFFDTRFSANGEVACASCHQPAKMFADGLPLATDGVGTTDRKTSTIIGTAYSPWQFWDGRKDSQWAQALGPLESRVEHGGTHTQYARLIDELYRLEYESLFGPLPDLSDMARFPESAGPVEEDPRALAAWEAMTLEDQEQVTRVYANIGKAIAAYERLILPGPSRFDEYVGALLEGKPTAAEILTPDEVAGLKLFVGPAQCTRCHNGPLLTNNSFHNTGVPVAADLPPDDGRASGVRKVLADEFNCLSAYSDADPSDCGELKFTKKEGPELIRAFKTPTLRNVAEPGAFMQAGQFSTLEQVLDHYNTARPAPAGDTELEPLGLSDGQLAQLAAFLKTLSAPLDVAPEWLQKPELP